MADNTFGTLNYTLLVQKALERFAIEHPQLLAFAANYSTENLKIGDTLIVKSVQNAVASEFNGVSFSAGGLVMTESTIALQKHLYCRYDLTEDERAKGVQKYEEDFIQSLVDALAAKMFELIFDMVTTATVAGVAPKIANIKTVAQAAFTRETVVDMGTELTESLIPASGRFAIVAPGYYGKLFSDTSIVGGLVNPGAGAAITTGVLPKVHGFSLTQYTALRNRLTPHFVSGLYGINSGLGIVTALPVAPRDGTGGTSEVVTAKGGFSVQLRRYGNWDAGKESVSVHALFGTSLIAANRLRAITSAAPVNT